MVTTTAIGAAGEFDRESLRLVANAVNSVNRVAKRAKDRVARNRMYEARHLLLSCVLEADTPEVRAGWQQQDNGDSLVLVSLGDLLTVHCPTPTGEKQNARDSNTELPQLWLQECGRPHLLDLIHNFFSDRYFRAFQAWRVLRCIDFIDL